jgi:hypothetical protein
MTATTIALAPAPRAVAGARRSVSFENACRETSSARPSQSIAAVDAAIFYQEVDAFSAAGLLALPASRY